MGNNLDFTNIAQGTTIKAVVKVESNMRLEGEIYGTVNCSGRLVLAKTAYIEGDIVCKTMLCEGTIKGNIVAQEQIHLFPTANVEGNIKYGSMKIDEGAVFNGQAISIKTPAAAKKKEAALSNA